MQQREWGIGKFARAHRPGVNYNQFSGWHIQLENWGKTPVQTAQPRDLGALALAVGVLLILLFVTMAFGTPAIR